MERVGAQTGDGGGVLKANFYTLCKKPCDRDRVSVTHFVLGISYPHAAER